MRNFTNVDINLGLDQLKIWEDKIREIRSCVILAESGVNIAIGILNRVAQSPHQYNSNLAMDQQSWVVELKDAQDNFEEAMGLFNRLVSEEKELIVDYRRLERIMYSGGYTYLF